MIYMGTVKKGLWKTPGGSFSSVSAADHKWHGQLLCGSPDQRSAKDGCGRGLPGGAVCSRDESVAWQCL